MLEQTLSSLGFSAEESRTYLALLEAGPSAAGALARRMGAKRPSVYGFLGRLVERGPATQSLKKGVKLFAAETPEKITRLFRDKIEELETSRRRFESMIPDLEAKIPGDCMSPRFELFEGREGVQNVLKDMLLYSGIATRSYWPMQDMVDILGSDFFRYHNKIRIGNKISVKAIWPQKKVMREQIINLKEHPYLGGGRAFLREIRIAPAHVDFSMGYWIYKNKVAFLSSRRESFGFIIESAELAGMMESQHETIWRQSEKLETRAEDVASFLREIGKAP